MIYDREQCYWTLTVQDLGQYFHNTQYFVFHGQSLPSNKKARIAWICLTESMSGTDLLDKSAWQQFSGRRPMRACIIEANTQFNKRSKLKEWVLQVHGWQTAMRTTYSRKKLPTLRRRSKTVWITGDISQDLRIYSHYSTNKTPKEMSPTVQEHQCCTPTEYIQEHIYSF